MGNITFNPMTASNAGGLFQVSSNGYTQGDAQDDPAVKFQLQTGLVSSNQSTPIVVGMPIQTLVPTVNSVSGTNTGSLVLAATSLATSTGIAVSNKGYAAIAVPGQNTAPNYSSGMSINYYYFGSRARIALPISAAFASALAGGQTNQNATWDYTNNYLTTYDSTNKFPILEFGPVSLTGNKVITLVGGIPTWTNTGPLVMCLI